MTISKLRNSEDYQGVDTEGIGECKKCGYEINGKASDYAPICDNQPQCNECIECLLYCVCSSDMVRNDSADDDWWEGSEEQKRSSDAWDDHLQKLELRESEENS